MLKNRQVNFPLRRERECGRGVPSLLVLPVLPVLSEAEASEAEAAGFRQPV